MYQSSCNLNTLFTNRKTNLEYWKDVLHVNLQKDTSVSIDTLVLFFLIQKKNIIFEQLSLAIIGQGSKMKTKKSFDI